MHLSDLKNLGQLWPHLRRRNDIDALKRAGNDPKFFIEMLNDARVEKACIVAVVSPDVIGSDWSMNDFVSDYCSGYPDRLIPFGSIHPRLTKTPEKELDKLLEKLDVRGIKIHPCHQQFYPNGYRTTTGPRSLKKIYSLAEQRRVPIMIHTGTSMFPNSRNVFGDPIYIDDVAVDFPELKIIMAHGGRPIWMETAFFLVRRHKNVYLDISGIPPARILDYFPRLEMIADKTMFGSDWPDPAVPGIKENVDMFLKLPLSAEAKSKILRETAMKVMDV